jgi:hypothetical protein
MPQCEVVCSCCMQLLFPDLVSPEKPTPSTASRSAHEVLLPYQANMPAVSTEGVTASAGTHLFGVCSHAQSTKNVHKHQTRQHETTVPLLHSPKADTYVLQCNLVFATPGSPSHERTSPCTVARACWRSPHTTRPGRSVHQPLGGSQSCRMHSGT